MEAKVPGLNVPERCSDETLHRSFEAELCSGSRHVTKAKMNTFVKKKKLVVSCCLSPPKSGTTPQEVNVIHLWRSSAATFGPPVS